MVNFSMWNQELTKKRDCLSKDRWNLCVLRDDLATTVIDVMADSLFTDWQKTMKVEFLDEPGVDGGGLFREMMTSLFRETPLMEGPVFSISAKALDDRRPLYKFLGQAVAYAFVLGHPGFERLDPTLTEYIITQTIPSLENLHLDAATEAAIKAVRRNDNIIPSTYH